MKLSVFFDHILQAAEQTKKPLPELLQEVKASGIQAVEINMTYLREKEETYELLRKAGLGVSCVYEFYEMQQKEETKKAQDHIAIAQRAGADKILVVPGFLAEETAQFAECVGDSSRMETFLNQNEKADTMVNGMKKLVEMADRAGITVVIEDFDDEKSPISCVNGMKWFMERVPHLKAAFDTGNFIIYKDDLFEAWDALKDRVVHVHCKDRGQEPVAVGDGYIPMRKIVGKILESGYDGYFAIEHFDAADQERCINRSAAFLKSLIDRSKV